MAEPITHLEKTIAGQVSPVTHLEQVIAEHSGGDINEQLVAGTNIVIEPTADGKAKISASGEVSSEDTYARGEIQAILDGTTIDSFGDVETALADKVDKVEGKGLSANDFTNEYKDKVDNSLSTTTAAETYQPKGSYATTSDISDMATETWVGQQGFLTSADEVPEVKSSDDGKVLKASYSGGTGTYSWQSGGGSGGTTDYTDLTNKPSINSVTLSGNKTSSDLGLQSTIDSSHKLSADLIDDTSSTNKFNVQADWEASSGVAEILHKPTLGTAAALDVAVSGNASTSQIVKGDDTRLTDSRNAADVSAWAKAANKPSYIGSEITLTGYAEAQSKASVAATDTTNAAIGKLEYRVETNETNISSVKQVPAVGFGDDSKVLTAAYSGGTGSYSWVSPTTYGYASQSTAGLVRVWTTTDGTDTILHIANEAPTP